MQACACLYCDWLEASHCWMVTLIVATWLTGCWTLDMLRWRQPVCNSCVTSCSDSGVRLNL